LFERYADIDSFVMPASEFRYGTPKLDEDTLCIFVSQSGETADTLAAVKLANEKGAATVAITNVLGSSISRTADVTLYTAAGPEIAVASTKAYTTQIVLLICLIMKLADKCGFAIPEYAALAADMKRLPQILKEILILEGTVEKLAEMLADQRDAYFIGRQLDYPTALEGALKLKEVSYVHADAYYAGELKHGPIALIEKNTVVVAMATQPEVAAKTMSNIQETIARGARIILITDSTIPADRFEYVLRVPPVREELAGIAAVVLLQLFAYFTAKEKGCDIDKPRNLAKSVTVE
ncbi:MAG: SIS domain-containing protein, partial [Solobacterium sp.]|nr:SIS domain-containing protein [Solobacterium sp.]